MLNRLKWYADRIGAMSGPELVFRGEQLARRAAEALRHAAGSAPGLADQLRDSSLAALGALCSAERQFLPLVDQWVPSGAAVPDAALATIAEAEHILAGRWTMLGHEVSLADPLDWHRDQVTGRRWPERFYPLVDHRGGAKFTWELSRHQFVATLARAHLWTGRRDFAERAVALLGTWIRQNRPYVGVNWASPFECALRIEAWSLVFHATRRSGAWSRERLTAFLASFGAQASFVEDHPSRYSSANNHRIGEAAALACAGLAFPEFRNAARWRERGVADLERELLLQILPDGTGAEQAPYYLACIADHALLVEALLRRRGGGLSAPCRERLVAAGRFLERLGAGGYALPAVGDSDDGRAIPLDDVTVGTMDAARLGIAALLGAGELRREGDAVLERTAWLCGLPSPGAAPARAPGARSELFAAGGTSLVVSPAGRALFDHGPLGYLSIAAHGHADALSVLVDDRSGPLLVDCGTCVYHEAPEWRRYFRGTRAHNTVMVAGRDQSEQLGDTLWGRRASCVVELSALGGRVQCAIARHDGYATLMPPVQHRRALLDVNGQYRLIVDWLLGGRVPAAEILWHFHRDVSVAPEGAAAWRLSRPGGGSLRFAAAATVPLAARLATGELDPPLGWASDRYGERHAIATLVQAAPAGAAWAAAMVIGAQPANVAIRADGGTTQVDVRSDAFVDTITSDAGGVRVARNGAVDLLAALTYQART